MAPRSTYVILAIAVITVWMTPASAQDPVPIPAQPSEAPASTQPVSRASDAALTGLSARKAVHEGNRRLLANDATGALEAYRHAEAQSPNASEIAFVEGLAQFDLKAYEQAREAFEESAATSTGRLANDARYSLGTCDHAEALEHLDDPKAALPLLEKAMRRYQGVLADDTEHEAARDAMLKAAAMRRQIKQQMEQQQQQQQSDDDQEKNDDENQDQEKQPSDSDQEENDQKQNEDQEQKSEDSSEKEDAEPRDKSSESQEQEDPDEEEEPKPSEEEEKEQVSREQAERKLREMMQAMRDRKKSRREMVRAPAAVPVRKDW